MLCEKCGQNPATVRFVKIENNNKTELHLCQTCAQGYTGFAAGFDLQNILASMFDQPKARSEAGPVRKQCPTCKLTLSDLQRTGQLGCSDCYAVFKPEINVLLRRLHGSTKHVGKVPATSHARVKVEREIEEARRRLEECVRTENYEQAAHYRDEIRRLEQELVKEGDTHEGH